MKNLAANTPLEYTPLSALPGTTANNGTATLQTYLPGMFLLTIGLAAVLAVGWIIWGGIEYITSDAIGGKSEGKKRIWNAVIGLAIVACSYLILKTINPALLTLNLNIEPIPEIKAQAVIVGAGVSTPGVAMTTAQITESNARRISLQTEGILTNHDPCTQGQTSGCTNLNGLPNTALDGLAVLSSNLGCSQSNPCLTITGGTEGGHATHGVGDSVVDLSPASNLNQYLGKTSPQEGDTVTKVYKVDGAPDVIVTFKYEAQGGNPNGTSSGNHWHTTFK